MEEESSNGSGGMGYEKNDDDPILRWMEERRKDRTKEKASSYSTLFLTPLLEIEWNALRRQKRTERHIVRKSSIIHHHSSTWNDVFVLWGNTKEVRPHSVVSVLRDQHPHEVCDKDFTTVKQEFGWVLFPRDRCRYMTLLSFPK